MKNKRRPRKPGASTIPPAAKMAAENAASADFQRRKLIWAMAIMGVGMLVALVWSAVQGWGLGRDYPYNTFLFSPQSRFNDFTDMTLVSSRANPYEDPFTAYLPFAWLFFRAFSAMPYFFSITAFLFICVGGLFALLFKALAGVVISPWKRVLLSLLFLAWSYPLLAAADRANLEILVALHISTALFFFSRGNYKVGTLCLLPVMSFKLYPALLFLLLLRQRKWELIAYGVVAFLVVIFLSLWALALPLETGFENYGRNLVLINRFYIYENYELEGSASLWNAYKVCLISAAKLGLISPVNFSFDGSFIGLSYSIYNCCNGLLVMVLVGYVCLLEKEFMRCALVLILYLAVASPLGGDYRLLYASIALVVLILTKTRRPHDFLILVLLALVTVPKKEILLAYAGKTETGFADVSLQVLLNPLFILGALALILYDSRASLDGRWSQLRWQRLLRSLLARQSFSVDRR